MSKTPNLPRRVLVRFDSGVSVGGGHLYRCVALSQWLIERSWNVTFVGSSIPVDILEKLQEWHIDFIQIPESVSFAQEPTFLSMLQARLDPSWIVFDGYHFNDSYVRNIDRDHCFVLSISDGEELSGEFDLIVNGDSAVSRKLEGRVKYGSLLAGTQYLILRKEFSSGESWGLQETPSVLLTFGAADEENLASGIIAKLESESLPLLNLSVLVGPFFSGWKALDRQVGASRHRVEIVRDPDSVLPLMLRSQCAISSAGMTAWELASKGVPSLLVQTAGNQKANYQALVQSRAVIGLGTLSSLSDTTVVKRLSELLDDSEKLRMCSSLAKGLCDGKGALRVVMKMEEALKMRRANEN